MSVVISYNVITVDEFFCRYLEYTCILSINWLAHIIIVCEGLVIKKKWNWFKIIYKLVLKF